MSGAALAVSALAAYLAGLLWIGLAARRARCDDSLRDFYLAGGRLPTLVLFFTLYATQYSGNTLIGYPGEAYRVGFAWIMSVGFLMAIVVAYLLYAPQLYPLSRAHGFVTPGDFLDHRFGLPALTGSVNLLLVVALSNYLLAQLMAMGHVVAGFTEGAVPYWAGVLGFTVAIAVYETLGGMRAVAWTDCLQGMLLLVGLVGMLAAVAPSPDRLAELTGWLLANRPEKAEPPAPAALVNWASTVLLVGLSGAVYPQAIQRLYAARSLATLKRALALMAFMPLLTLVPVVLIGVEAATRLPGLEGVAADQVMPRLLKEWAAAPGPMGALALVTFVGAVAAIMSTADSVLLSLSSILAKDVLGRSLLARAPERALTLAGKGLSWLVVAGLLAIAVRPRLTLWGLTELKMELLAQVAPAFVLGVRWPSLRGGAVLAGLLTGTLFAGGLLLAGQPRPGGVHAGVLGLAANVIVCVALSRRSGGAPDASRGDHAP